jgi:hypothetical protein
MSWFKREAKTVVDDLDTWDAEIEAEVKKLGSAAKSIIHHDILDHAADTVASLKAKAQADKNKFVDRLKEIEHEASGLIENVQHVDAVIHHADNFLSGLVAATDAKADVAQPQAPVDTVVDAALSPAAE